MEKPKRITKRRLYLLLVISVAVLSVVFLLKYPYLKIKFQFYRCANALQKYDLIKERAISEEDEELLCSLKGTIERNPEYYLTLIFPQLASEDPSNVLCSLALCNCWKTLCILTNEYHDYVAFMKTHKREIDQAVLPILPNLLKHEDPRIRHLAAQMSYSFPNQEVKAGLVSLLQEDTVPDVRAAAACSLGSYREDKAVIILLVTSTLKDKDHIVRYYAFLGATNKFPENVELSDRKSTYNILLSKLSEAERKDAPSWQEWWQIDGKE